MDKWIAVNYPSDVIQNQRTRTIIGLLFDTTICHFPIEHIGPCGGVGVSDLALYEDLLAEEGVIEPREEYLVDEVEADFSSGTRWGTPDEFSKYYGLQITALATNVYINEGAIPVTDDQKFSVPFSYLERMDIFRSASLQASMLAIHSLNVALPAIATLSDENILQARGKLKDQLIPFRSAMLKLAPTMRNGIDSGVTPLEMQREAKYIVDTQIAPALRELKVRIKKEKGRFWNNLLLKGSTIVPRFILNYATQGAIRAAIDLLGDFRGIVGDSSPSREAISTLKQQGGFGYLLEVGDTLQEKVHNRNQDV